MARRITKKAVASAITAVCATTMMAACSGAPSSSKPLSWVDSSTNASLTENNGEVSFNAQSVKSETDAQGRLYLNISAPQCNDSNRILQINISDKQHWTISVPTSAKELVIGNKIEGDKNTITLTPSSSEDVSSCGPITIHQASVKDDGAQVATLHMNPFINYPPSYNMVYLDKVAKAQQETASDPRSKNLDKLKQPAAVWLGTWTPKGMVEQMISENVALGLKSGRKPVFVIYGIRGIDCNKNYETGFKENEYYDWLNSIANSLGNSNSVIIYEPDALPFTNDPSCKSPQGNRTEIMTKGIDILSTTQSTIYIDAGNANWIPAARMAEMLKNVGIDKVRGFSLNVSNTYATDTTKKFGEQLSGKLGGKSYVIDTSRNGNGYYDGDDMSWCNPPGRKIGENPTAVDDSSDVDALLWVKNPGESDELCRGGPKAGEFWNDYALGLVSN